MIIPFFLDQSIPSVALLGGGISNTILQGRETFASTSEALRSFAQSTLNAEIATAQWDLKNKSASSTPPFLRNLVGRNSQLREPQFARFLQDNTTRSASSFQNLGDRGFAAGDGPYRGYIEMDYGLQRLNYFFDSPLDGTDFLSQDLVLNRIHKDVFQPRFVVNTYDICFFPFAYCAIPPSYYIVLWQQCERVSGARNIMSRNNNLALEPFTIAQDSLYISQKNSSSAGDYCLLSSSCSFSVHNPSPQLKNVLTAGQPIKVTISQNNTFSPVNARNSGYNSPAVQLNAQSSLRNLCSHVFVGYLRQYRESSVTKGPFETINLTFFDIISLLNGVDMPAQMLASRTDLSAFFWQAQNNVHDFSYNYLIAPPFENELSPTSGRENDHYSLFFHTSVRWRSNLDMFQNLRGFCQSTRMRCFAAGESIVLYGIDAVHKRTFFYGCMHLDEKKWMFSAAFTTTPLAGSKHYFLQQLNTQREPSAKFISLSATLTVAKAVFFKVALGQDGARSFEGWPLNAVESIEGVAPSTVHADEKNATKKYLQASDKSYWLAISPLSVGHFFILENDPSAERPIFLHVTMAVVPLASTLAPALIGTLSTESSSIFSDAGVSPGLTYKSLLRLARVSFPIITTDLNSCQYQFLMWEYLIKGNASGSEHARYLRSVFVDATAETKTIQLSLTGENILGKETLRYITSCVLHSNLMIDGDGSTNNIYPMAGGVNISNDVSDEKVTPGVDDSNIRRTGDGLLSTLPKSVRSSKDKDFKIADNLYHYLSGTTTSSDVSNFQEDRELKMEMFRAFTNMHLLQIPIFQKEQTLKLGTRASRMEFVNGVYIEGGGWNIKNTPEYGERAFNRGLLLSKIMRGDVFQDGVRLFQSRHCIVGISYKPVTVQVAEASLRRLVAYKDIYFKGEEKSRNSVYYASDSAAPPYAVSDFEGQELCFLEGLEGGALPVKTVWKTAHSNTLRIYASHEPQDSRLIGARTFYNYQDFEEDSADNEGNYPINQFRFICRRFRVEAGGKMRELEHRLYIINDSEGWAGLENSIQGFRIYSLRESGTKFKAPYTLNPAFVAISIRMMTFVLREINQPRGNKSLASLVKKNRQNGSRIVVKDYEVKRVAAKEQAKVVGTPPCAVLTGSEINQSAGIDINLSFENVPVRRPSFGTVNFREQDFSIQDTPPYDFQFLEKKIPFALFADTQANFIETINTAFTFPVPKDREGVITLLSTKIYAPLVFAANSIFKSSSHSPFRREMPPFDDFMYYALVSWHLFLRKKRPIFQSNLHFTVKSTSPQGGISSTWNNALHRSDTDFFLPELLLRDLEAAQGNLLVSAVDVTVAAKEQVAVSMIQIRDAAESAAEKNPTTGNPRISAATNSLEF